MAHEGFVIPPATEAFVQISRVEVSNIPLTLDFIRLEYFLVFCILQKQILVEYIPSLYRYRYNMFILFIQF